MQILQKTGELKSNRKLLILQVKIKVPDRIGPNLKNKKQMGIFIENLYFRP